MLSDGHLGAPSVEPQSQGLWDPVRRAFHGPRLHQAILARGWTMDEFARATKLHAGSVYNAVRGHRVRDVTAIRIFEALEKRSPMTVAVG